MNNVGRSRRARTKQIAGRLVRPSGQPIVVSTAAINKQTKTIRQYKGCGYTIRGINGISARDLVATLTLIGIAPELPKVRCEGDTEQTAAVGAPLHESITVSRVVDEGVSVKE
jgi:hypothetical protein